MVIIQFLRLQFFCEACVINGCQSLNTLWGLILRLQTGDGDWLNLDWLSVSNLVVPFTLGPQKVILRSFKKATEMS